MFVAIYMLALAGLGLLVAAREDRRGSGEWYDYRVIR